MFFLLCVHMVRTDGGCMCIYEHTMTLLLYEMENKQSNTEVNRWLIFLFSQFSFIPRSDVHLSPISSSQFALDRYQLCSLPNTAQPPLPSPSSLMFAHCHPPSLFAHYSPSLLLLQLSFSQDLSEAVEQKAESEQFQDIIASSSLLPISQTPSTMNLHFGYLAAVLI